uniref:Sec1 family domain containing 2 n=1 Tax=Hucho hucho TaxID=62062 RepID=A0A4W5Q2B2_9TELE
MTLNRLIRNVYYFLMSVLSLPLSGRVTPEQLYSYVQLFKSNWGALESHCGVIQLGLATAQTLHHPTLPRWDACLAFERLLLQAMYRPFLRQVLEEIFHPDRPESPDIEHMSGSLTDMLKTGFSMFMKVSRPHPSDHALLFLFLVGGVTPSELRLIREVVSAHKPGTQVLVLSTRLLRPTDVPELLFTTQRLVPDIGV